MSDFDRKVYANYQTGDVVPGTEAPEWVGFRNAVASGMVADTPEGYEAWMDVWRQGSKTRTAEQNAMVESAYLDAEQSRYEARPEVYGPPTTYFPKPREINLPGPWGAWIDERLVMGHAANPFGSIVPDGWGEGMQPRKLQFGELVRKLSFNGVSAELYRLTENGLVRVATIPETVTPAGPIGPEDVQTLPASSPIPQAPGAALPVSPATGSTPISGSSGGSGGSSYTPPLGGGGFGAGGASGSSSTPGGIQLPGALSGIPSWALIVGAVVLLLLLLG